MSALQIALKAVIANANGDRDSGYANVPWATIDNAAAALEAVQVEPVAIVASQAKDWQHKIDTSPVPVLYTDALNGEQVHRDDIWLATTNQLRIPLGATPQPAPAWTEVADGLPEIDVPVLAMINDKPYIYPFCRVDVGDDGWMWADYKIDPLNDPASYEADDDYDVVRWMLMPAPRSKS